MSFADLKSLFEDSRFDLPYVETDDTKSFLHHYKVRMHQYLKELKKIPQSALGKYDKDDLSDDVTYTISQLEEVLRLYLDGLPSQSYNCFKALVETPFLASLVMHWRIISLNTNTPLYRTKREYNYRSNSAIANPNGFINFIEPIDLFHVPFEKRKAIGTNRFSIPGFPCIYLSGTLHTSWSEALGDTRYPFHAASFRNHRPIYIVDVVPAKLATPPTATVDYLGSLYNYDDPNDAFLDHVLMFPLITACHSKVAYIASYDGEIKFKSEYIIPQLLLQWYRDNHITIDGIRYLSCTADARFPGVVFDKFNYVIPAIDMKEEGYCESLLHNYSATPVYSHLEYKSQTEIEMLDEITRELGKSTFITLQQTLQPRK